jgi:hypothetical protein
MFKQSESVGSSARPSSAAAIEREERHRAEAVIVRILRLERDRFVDRGERFRVLVAVRQHARQHEVGERSVGFVADRLARAAFGGVVLLLRGVREREQPHRLGILGLTREVLAEELDRRVVTTAIMEEPGVFESPHRHIPRYFFTSSYWPP